MTQDRELAEVLALLEKATPGEWEADSAICSKHGSETPAVYSHVQASVMRHTFEVVESPCKCGDPAVSADDAKAIAAAVNFLRKHGPALLAALSTPSSEGDGRDAARYRWLRRNWQFDITTDVWMWCDVDCIDDTGKLDAAIDAAIAAAEGAKES